MLIEQSKVTLKERNSHEADERFKNHISEKRTGSKGEPILRKDQGDSVWPLLRRIGDAVRYRMWKRGVHSETVCRNRQ